MKKTNTTRMVIFVTAFSSVGLLAGMQGCSSDDTPANPDTDSGPSSSSGDTGPGTSSGSPDGSITDSGKTDSGPKTDSGTDSGACFDNTRTADAGGDAGSVPCPGAGACDDICTGIYAAFKADVADDIIKTLVPATDCVATDADGLRQTVVTKAKASSAKSCVDTSVAQWCGAVPVFANCKGDATFDANCAALVKGMTGNGTFGDTNTGGRLTAWKCMNDKNSPGYPNCNACLLAVSSGIVFTDNP